MLVLINDVSARKARICSSYLLKYMYRNGELMSISVMNGCHGIDQFDAKSGLASHQLISNIINVLLDLSKHVTFYHISIIYVYITCSSRPRDSAHS